MHMAQNDMRTVLQIGDIWFEEKVSVRDKYLQAFVSYYCRNTE